MQDEIRVWDPLVRIGHWTLALAFLVAYVTAEELEEVHVAAGYWVGAYVVARTIWGFVGTRYARFSDFVRGPGAVFGYLRDLAKGKPAHYIGHNPAGGAMIVALLICLASTVFTGLMVEADADNEGPLAAWLGHPATQSVAPQVGPVERLPAKGETEEEKERESAYSEPHELFANLSLGLVVLHLLGVLAGSVVHRENLPRAMVTGRKAATPKVAGGRDRPGSA
ncbi:cytochrome b/b6 domain-containing protein [Nevskia soli]|uniref:cytochrome b/b6 domain-containing protein n=1 Tax=Nevskia soli TaxID=418856 RepID=UPI000A0730D8|nr:cytochrome b/b6 domain-containing protein [Nevskia soli]